MCSIDIGIGRNLYSVCQKKPPVTILIQERVTQVDPLSIILYGITLVSLAKELRAKDPGLLSPFYMYNATFDDSARRSAHLLKLLMKRGP